MSDVAPSESKIQQESVQFDQPVSESSGSSIGALANFLREICQPVGSVIYSMLDEATFQAQNTSPSPARWILADGRSVVGSRYETLTGLSTVPDLRGVIIRGKNYARSGATGNPDGNLAVGTYTADKFGSHDHGFNDPGHSHTYNNGGARAGFNIANGSNIAVNSLELTTPNVSNINFTANGGNETAPRTVTMNAFIRVN